MSADHSRYYLGMRELSQPATQVPEIELTVEPVPHIPRRYRIVATYDGMMASGVTEPQAAATAKEMLNDISGYLIVDHPRSLMDLSPGEEHRTAAPHSVSRVVSFLKRASIDALLHGWKTPWNTSTLPATSRRRLACCKTVLGKP